MLIQQNGKCENCKRDFGQFETIQSTEVTCKVCAKEIVVCSNCKEKGCECGGKYFDAWDKNPGIMF